MALFHETLVTENAELLERARTHPLFERLASGTMDDQLFLEWLAQNYLWTRGFERFVMAFGQNPPPQIRDALSEALLGVHILIEEFEELYAKLGPGLAPIQPNLECHSFKSFMTATVHTRPLEEALTACYGANYSFLSGWLKVRAAQGGDSRWKDFVVLWTDEGLHGWVESLAGFCDQLATKATEDVREQMRRIFPIAIHYSIRFWNSAFAPDKR